MYCPQCGAELPEDAIFCSRCGSRIIAPELPVPTEAPRQNSATPKSSVADKPTEQLSAPTFGGILRGALPVLSLVAGLVIGRSFVGGTLYYLGAMGILGGLARSIPGGGCGKWLVLGITFVFLSVLTGSVFNAR